MATDYSSLKVPELKKLLQERGLPATGNKLDLVNRLKENDKQSAPTAEEDEIDYSDDEPAPAKAPDAPKPVAEPVPAVADPAPASAATDAAEPAAPATADAAPEAAPAAETATEEEKPEEEAPKENFALNLDATDASEEARKRAERAKRFGIVEGEEEKKKSDRAKRFGADAAANTSALDSALPERRPKRGRPERNDEQPGRDTKRQSTDGRGRRGRGNNRHGRQGGGRQGGGGGGNSEKRSGPIDPAEKAKLEARAKRFAA